MLPGRSLELPGNRHPQMNDRCLRQGQPGRGNRIRLMGCAGHLNSADPEMVNLLNFCVRLKF